MFVWLFTPYVIKFQSDTVHKTLQSTPLTSGKEEAAPSDEFDLKENFI